jgi:hypothetical protein
MHLDLINKHGLCIWAKLAGGSPMRIMVAKDYTVLPVGTKIERGEIRVCPICGKNGIAINIGGEVFYTHTYTITENAQGEIAFGDETCSARSASAG